MNKIKGIIMTVAGITFLAAAYYLPTDVFMGLFAAGLFLIPTAFFVQIIQRMKEGENDNVE